MAATYSYGGGMLPGFTDVSMFPLLWEATVNNLMSIIDRSVST
jgi:hypothetical protein